MILPLHSSLAVSQTERVLSKTAVDAAQMLEGEKYLIYAKAGKTWTAALNTHAQSAGNKSTNVGRQQRPSGILILTE